MSFSPFTSHLHVYWDLHTSSVLLRGCTFAQARPKGVRQNKTQEYKISRISSNMRDDAKIVFEEEVQVGHRCIPVAPANQ